MLKKAICGLVLVVSTCAVGMAFAAVPTMHQVEDAARAGRMNEAHDMMQQVLKEHPDSAKAHFVDAEILAKMGRVAEARDELNAAEKLKPGLPFAKPHAVEELKAKLGQPRPVATQPQPSAVKQTSTPANNAPSRAQAPSQFESKTPWAAIFAAIGVLLLVVFLVRMFRSNPSQPYGSNNYQGNPAGGNQPGGGYHPGMQPGYCAPGSSGIGSGIVSGLATGAALGAGLVAGEALAHHFIDGKSSDSSSAPSPASPAAQVSQDNQASAGNYDNSYDMGGADFGVNDDSSWSDNTAVADNSSWDNSSSDSGSDGGSDSSGGGDWT